MAGDFTAWYLLLIPIIFITYLVSRRRSKNGLPDGPRTPLPLTEIRHRLHLHFTDWSKTYGDVFTYKLGAFDVLVLNSVESIQELMFKRAAIYSSRPTSSPQAEIITGGTGILPVPYGDDFRVRD
jgi:cytochrome P450 family 619